MELRVVHDVTREEIEKGVSYLFQKLEDIV